MYIHIKRNIEKKKYNTPIIGQNFKINSNIFSLFVLCRHLFNIWYYSKIVLVKCAYLFKQYLNLMNDLFLSNAPLITYI